MNKELSVVFPILEQDGKFFVLLGKCAPGKKLEGILNGFGGKCEHLPLEGRMETTLECAKRELEEELSLQKNFGIEIKDEEYKKIGSVTMGYNKIDFFVINLNQRISVEDNSEFVDINWFELDLEKEDEEFVKYMLSGDDELIKNLKRYLRSTKENLGWIQFEINKSEDRLLREQTKNVFNK